MLQPYMHEPARRAMNRAIFIAGNARSGTTILGKILYSFNTVEYTFEPPFLFSLLPLIHELPEAQFRAMFEAYGYEDVLLGALGARNLNFNSNDDSFVYRSKSETEIKARLQNGWPKERLLDAAEKSRLCIKMPDIGAPLQKLMAYYPGMQVVATHRKANPVIESIIKKKWYSNESLQQHTQIWPSQAKDGITIPMWVEKEFVKDWLGWTELERAGYYYVRIARELSKLKNAIFFSYEQMVENPKAAVSSLAKKLQLDFGPQTEALLATVETKSPKGENWIAKLPSHLQKQVQEYDSLGS